MTSNSVDNIVSKLQDKVNTIVTKNNSSTIKHIMPVQQEQQSSIDIKPYIYYAAIPIVLIIIIIIILYILKPKFIMDKQEDDNYRINFKKMIITTVVLGGIIGGGIVGWKYYKRV